jgi:hypothetical protein
MPGVTTASGSRAPTGTSSSTSAMVVRAAMAIMGAKFRVVLRNTRLPWASPFQALMNA